MSIFCCLVDTLVTKCLQNFVFCDIIIIGSNRNLKINWKQLRGIMKQVTSNKLIALGIATMASVMINHSVLANTEETVITKQDDVITVEKPEVTMSTQEAYNYDAVNITYQTEIPDEMEINAGVLMCRQITLQQHLMIISIHIH